jgi:hypothetical protein
MTSGFAQPSREEIKQFAYRLWEEPGRPVGSPDVDWFRAERELSLTADSPMRLPFSTMMKGPNRIRNRRRRAIPRLPRCSATEGTSPGSPAFDRPLPTFREERVTVRVADRVAATLGLETPRLRPSKSSIGEYVPARSHCRS